MKKTIIFLLIVLPAISFGQETKKVIKKNEDQLFKEVYYVLKTDKSIRQGNYQKLNLIDEVNINGYYKNGLKDSLWTEFKWGDKLSEGMYSNDKRIGVWEFYDHEGEIEQKYDYTKNEMIYFKIYDKQMDKEYRVIKGGDTTKTKLDRKPLYIGGSAMMFEPIYKNIRYPQQAKQNEISGTVYVTFFIDSTGKTSDHRVTKGIGYGCDEEALRVVKLIPDNWFPGLLDEEAVNVEFVFPINFNVSVIK